MITLGNLILPTSIDYDTHTNTIIFEKPDYGTFAYIENSECYLQLTFQNDDVFVDYYCEDDFMLSSEFGLDHLAVGNLEDESFEEIQARALTVLKELTNL